MDIMEIVEAPEVLPRVDLDAAWKEILGKYFKDFVQLCWSEIFDKIDWTRSYRFLEQEFHAILKKEEMGKRILDKLVQVYLKDGRDVWALLHFEIQGDDKQGFPERIFIYRYRIFDRHKKDIATLAILIDANRDWRPNVYEKEFWGSKLRLEYPILKILDFQKDKEVLLKSKNPFALVVLAQLAAIETAGDNVSRRVTKFELTKWLYYHGWDKGKIHDLLRFLEEVMVLPKALELEYHHQVNDLEKELNVSYMTHVEKMWLEQGMQQGMQQGEGALLTQLLKSKFESVPEFYSRRIADANEQHLLTWAIRVLKSNTIEEVFEEQSK